MLAVILRTMPEFISERRYQVFVSSTFLDLQIERQKVLQAILELKAFPTGMELFPSADDEQFEFIKREIDSSDYYIVIVAGKYGSLAPDGISYTEKEYDYAVHINKPVMAFLFKDLGELKANQLESEPVAKKKLDNFREKARSSKLVKFFSSPEELRSAVLMSLVHNFQVVPREGWVRAKNARRLEDLEEVTSLLKQVAELKAENESLKAASNLELETLAQGTDKLAFNWDLVEVKVDDTIISPPTPVFSMKVSWDELFIACFSYSLPRAELKSVKRGLANLIRSALSEEHSGEWAKNYDPQALGESSMEVLVNRLRVQFLGLGLIEIDEEFQKPDSSNLTGSIATYYMTTFATRREYWKLTQKGSLRCALLAGYRRMPVTQDISATQ